MADDFILDEEEETNGSPGRRNFLIIASILGLIFVAAMVCNFTLLSRNQNEDVAAEATARTIQNATIIAQNATTVAGGGAVEETPDVVQAGIDGTNTAQAQPTDEPEEELVATNTSEPEETPTPTNTAVVKTNETATPNFSGTSEFEDADDGEEDGDSDGTETPNASIGASSTTSTPVPSTSTNQDALPETGINTWGTIVIGLLLVGALIGARRFRQA